MILRPEQLQLLRLGLPIVPCNDLGGGSSSSSSQSSQTTNQVDRRQVVDGNSVGLSSDSSTVTVNVLDQGAIGKALELVQNSDQETGKSVATVLGFAKDVFSAGIGVLKNAGDQVKGSSDLAVKAYDDAKGAGTEKFLLAGAAIATVAIVAVKVWGKS